MSEPAKPDQFQRARKWALEAQAKIDEGAAIIADLIAAHRAALMECERKDRILHFRAITPAHPRPTFRGEVVDYPKGDWPEGIFRGTVYQFWGGPAVLELRSRHLGDGRWEEIGWRPLVGSVSETEALAEMEAG
jgi:hypothetical protein